MKYKQAGGILIAVAFLIIILNITYAKYEKACLTLLIAPIEI